jgi:hypothetical protein
MLLALILFAGAMIVIGFAAWFLGSRNQPFFKDETDWDERLLRPRAQRGFENLSAADLELTEIEIIDDNLATDDLGSITDRLDADSNADSWR